MFPDGELKALRARKQQLLNDSAVRRQLWAHEWRQVQQRLVWVERGVSTARRLLPLCSVAIPLIGLWRARASVGAGSMFARIANALPIARRLVKLWREHQAQRA